MGVLLEQWLAHLEAQGRAAKTIEGYQSLIRARLEPALGSIRLDRLTPADLDRFYRALLQDGLSRMSGRHRHAALSTALRQAVKWGWIERSPADRSSPPPVKVNEIKPPTAEQITALLRDLEQTHPELASMVYVAATTGCRRGELCGLRWSDIDLAAGTLTVRRSISDTNRGVAEKDPKTHRSRRIALDLSTVAVLETHHEGMRLRAAACEQVLTDNAYVWSQDPGCAVPFRPNRVTDAFRNARRRVGLPDIDFHHLRHFAATTLAGAGIDVRTIAGRLGHANPVITLKAYAHFLEAADRDAADVMGRMALGPAPNANG